MLTAEHTKPKLSFSYTDHDENWLDNANNVAFNSLSNELRKDGFINQRVIQTLARGSHDHEVENWVCGLYDFCLLYTSPSPRDRTRSRMPSSA